MTCMPFRNVNRWSGYDAMAAALRKPSAPRNLPRRIRGSHAGPAQTGRLARGYAHAAVRAT